MNKENEKAYTARDYAEKLVACIVKSNLPITNMETILDIGEALINEFSDMKVELSAKRIQELESQLSESQREVDLLKNSLWKAKEAIMMEPGELSEKVEAIYVNDIVPLLLKYPQPH